MKTKKILIAARGSLGDIYPYIAITRELERRGHDVWYVSSPFFKKIIEGQGLKFIPVKPDFPPASLTDYEKKKLAARAFSRDGARYAIEEYTLPTLKESFEDLMGVVRYTKADAILSHIAYAQVGAMVHQKTGIPWISSSMSPLFNFSACEPLVITTPSGLLRLTSIAPHNSLILGALKLATLPWTLRFNSVRGEVGLPWVLDPVFSDAVSPVLDLGLYSPTLAPLPADAPPQRFVTGCCFFDGHPGSEGLPDGLEGFLERGDAPLVFTLGSASSWVAGNFFEESIRAASLLGERAILLTGENFDSVPEHCLTERAVAYRYVPNSYLFPRAKAIIHAGGIMTSTEALRSGKPSLIVPFGFDQFDNAHRVRSLGCARIVSNEEYRAEMAAWEIRELLRGDRYLASSASAGERIARERGTATACDLIENLLGRG
jgi:UDP:flavonoid glycosyltransferase YjiC (YdhE family)